MGDTEWLFKAGIVLNRLADFGALLVDSLEGSISDEGLRSLADDWELIEVSFAELVTAWQATPEDGDLRGPGGRPLMTSKHDLGMKVMQADQMRAKLGLLWVTMLNRAFRDTVGGMANEALLRRVKEAEEDATAARAEAAEWERRAGGALAP